MEYKFVADLNVIEKILNNQLSVLWGGQYKSELVNRLIPEALSKIYENFKSLSLSRCNNGMEIIFSPCDTVSWAVFLYYLSNLLWKNHCEEEATVVYYLNKVLHSVEWFYALELPNHFFAEHPLNSVLGKAEYGDYFFVFTGQRLVQIIGKMESQYILYWAKMFLCVPTVRF
jgi:serine O-acetyltransferase